jgi:NAD(P)-dependent dehydrogenase (short-subunit alcohol dehydrogenase family)
VFENWVAGEHDAAIVLTNLSISTSTRGRPGSLVCDNLRQWRLNRLRCQKGLPLMNDGGSIILNTPIATTKGFPAMSVYSATRAAVRSVARTWTNELRERRIRANAISPGHSGTPILESLQQGDALTAMKEGFTKAVPLGRIGTLDGIMKVVASFASDEASYISAVELFVDGGLA